MKKIIIAAVAAVVLFGIFAFQTVRNYAGILKQLEMDPSEARESIFSNFQDGALNFPYSIVVTKFAVGKREAAVNEIGDYIKTYTASAEFAAMYNAAREEARPQDLSTASEQLSNRVSEIKNELAAMKQDAETSPKTGQAKKDYNQKIKSLQEELQALSNPLHPKRKSYAGSVREAKATEIEFAEEQLKYWQQDWPPTVNGLLKKRLAEFLNLTKDIDFNAKLLQQGNKMVFADPALEGRSDEWKRCFRCGKETIAAARSYAQRWLASLN